MFIDLFQGDSFLVLNLNGAIMMSGQVIDSSSFPEPEEHITRYCTKTKIKIGIVAKLMDTYAQYYFKSSTITKDIANRYIVTKRIMKRLLLILVLLPLISCCSSINQEGWMTNEVKVERIDSLDIYLLYWKGHLFLYNKSQSPCIIEIDTK